MKGILLVVVLLGCGREGDQGEPGRTGPAGSGCTTKNVSTGAVILCSDGSTAVVNNGKDGVNGISCTTTNLSNGARIDCSDGTHSVILNGSTGEKGDTGETGQAGTNGTNGTNGADAIPSAYSVASVINPCGVQPGFNEVLLKLANGEVLAHYSDGGKQFLTLLTPGNYITTDFNPCYFTLNTDGTIGNEHQ